MTEAEAKEKLCCGPPNRQGGITKCVGSGCMGWTGFDCAYVAEMKYAAVAHLREPSLEDMVRAMEGPCSTS